MNICRQELADVFEKEKPEIVNHQAAQTVITRSASEPLFDAEQNILGSLNLFLQCARFGVKRVIYASSGGAVYGEPRRCPVDESHPINTLSHYGVSKYTAENYLRLYQDVLDYVVLRYANVYGERQNFRGEAGVVAIFSRQMLNGEQPTIFGQGDKTRDYIYVSDVVEANLCALVEGSKTIYNIGTGVETSDQEVFDSLAEIFNYPEKPNYAEVRPGEVHRICLDCVDRQR